MVYNVESSHCYGNIPAFLEETYRVLRKGGKFCWTDMRDQKTMKEMQKQFFHSGFSIESSKEVTDNVLEALNVIDMDRETDQKERTTISEKEL